MIGPEAVDKVAKGKEKVSYVVYKVLSEIIHGTETNYGRSKFLQ